MRKINSLCIFAITFLANLVYGETLVRLSDLSQEMIDSFFADKSPELILECNEGTQLPFYFTVESDTFALNKETETRTLQLLKTFYLKFINDTFYFSCDMHEWKEFQDFFTGTVSASLNSNEHTTFGLNIELNQR